MYQEVCFNPGTEAGEGGVNAGHSLSPPSHFMLATGLSGMVMPNFSFSLKKVSGTKGVLQSNQENCEHQKYFWNVIVLQEKSQSGARKLNRKQERQLFSNEIVYGSYVKCTYRKIPKISPSMYKPLQNISPPKSQCKKPSIKSPLL